MKIVIVDDEPRHRKGLSNLIGKLRPDYKIEQFKNGYDAFEFIKDNEAEIIITDVEMPTMDGLEFLKKYKEINNSCKVIILSGYPNFKYAQNALSLGAFDYILKPVDQDTVEDILARVEKAIKKEDENRKREMQLLDNLNKTIEVYMEWEFNRWIKGELNNQKLEAIKKYVKEDEEGWIIVIKVNQKKAWNLRDENEDEILNNIKSIISEMVKPYWNSITFNLTDYKKILTTVIKKNKQISNEISLEECNKILNHIEEKCHVDIVIGISRKCSNIIYEAKKYFEEAMEALKLKFYFPNTKIIYFSKEKRIVKNLVIINSKCEEMISEYIYKENKTEAIILIDEILFKSMKYSYLDPAEIRNNIISLFINIATKVKLFMTEDDYNNIRNNIIETINSCENIEELKKNCKLLIIKNISIFQRWKKDKNAIIFDKYLKYVEENYMYDISLESISEKFYFNPCYFSTMFKDRVGMTFVKYLLKLRIQKACELLLKSNKKIYEIATVVGYKEVKYFNRVFKNEMNISPDEYRRVNSAERCNKALI